MQRISVLVALVVLAFSATALAATRSVGAADNGKTLKLKKGDVVKLTLDECADCGYSWKTVTKPASKVIKTNSLKFVKPDLAPGAVGGIGTREGKFTAVGKGKTTLKLTYARGNAKPDKTYTLHFTVS